jgi:hypothetical protein
MATTGSCPLTQQQIIDEYFIEHRTKILDIAAFLDRLDRASARDAENDFRTMAFHAALRILTGGPDRPNRLEAIQLILSDPRTELLDHLDQKGAFGAHASTDGQEQ